MDGISLVAMSASVFAVLIALAVAVLFPASTLAILVQRLVRRAHENEQRTARLLGELHAGIDEIRGQLAEALAERPEPEVVGPQLGSLDLDTVLLETARLARAAAGSDGASVTAAFGNAEPETKFEGLSPADEQSRPFWPPPAGRLRSVALSYVPGAAAHADGAPPVVTGLAVPVEIERPIDDEAEETQTRLETIAMVSVFARHETVFDEQQVVALTRVARRVAPSIGNALLFRETRERAVTDAPTGLHNKAFLMEALATEVGRATRHRRPLALLFFDLDDFKRINTEHGPRQADAVVSEVAERLKASRPRSTDLLSRAGAGDEFAVVLPETNLAGAELLYRRLREAIAAEPVVHVGHVSLSAGIAELEQHETATSFFDRAAAAQGRAKHFGKGRLAASVSLAEAARRSGLRLWALPDDGPYSDWSSRITHLPSLSGRYEVVEIVYSSLESGTMVTLTETPSSEHAPDGDGEEALRIDREGTSVELRSAQLGRDWLERLVAALVPVPPTLD